MFNVHILCSRSFTSSASAYRNFQEHLRAFLSKGRLDEALTLFYTSNISHTQQTYADLFHACARHGGLSQGQLLHRHMVDTHNRTIFPNLYVTNHLINMYAKCGSVEHARKVFDEMGERNIVSWTALISGYAQSERYTESCEMFSKMLADYRPNEFAYASVLSSCDPKFGRQVHAHALKTCLDAYTYVANALITMYMNNDNTSMCKYEAFEAWTVFKFLNSRNLVTWNSMIAAFQTRGKWEEAVNLFSLMRQDSDIGFDRATLLSILSSLVICKDYGDNNKVIASCLKYCSQVHCLVIKTSFVLEIGVITALAKAYADLGAESLDLYNLFLETDGKRDIVSWTAFITIFSENNPEESLHIFSKLYKEGSTPDHHTYSIVLKACAGLVTDTHTLAIHSQILKYGFENDTILANALIHAYGRSGSLIESKKVFDSILFKDTISWNSMIKIHGLHGQSKDALKCFSQMNTPPDATTFVALLSACSHAGMVEEGTKIFETMSKSFKIVPQLDHYACMVDILGRCGRILEAQKLINEMPMEPDSVIWSAMLAACRKHGEPNLAKLAATKLQDLDPKNSLGYVLMSNIHFSSGTFNASVEIRNQMRRFGVRKDPGLSWIEIGSRVHEFAAGGIRHPQRKAIYADLEELVGELKQLGYVQESNLAMRDIEEEEKNIELNYHSEKLAFVFALKHGECKHGGRGIRIVKNIRICVDCHEFMKFASELVGREIVVRDSNRFHHFKERVCSCGDYW